MNPAGLEITEEWIRAVNGTVMQSSGEYRTTELYIGTPVEAVYYPPKSERVPALMRQFILDLRTASMLPPAESISRIAELHLQFERIHPFSDGNGRTGRMILCQMLMNAGLLPATIEHKSEYRQAFRIYDKNKDSSPMAHLLCKALNASAKTIANHAVKRERDQREWEQE